MGIVNSGDYLIFGCSVEKFEITYARNNCCLGSAKAGTSEDSLQNRFTGIANFNLTFLSLEPHVVNQADFW